jgi:hypothetical protein
MVAGSVGAGVPAGDGRWGWVLGLAGWMVGLGSRLGLDLALE